MSSEKRPVHENGNIISSRDLFGSIPKPLDVDPFEGIDIDDISIYMKAPEGEEDGDIDLANPLEGIDFSDITGMPKDKSKEEEEGFSLEGIDPQYISVKADPNQDYRLPVEEEDAEEGSSEKRAAAPPEYGEAF